MGAYTYTIPQFVIGSFKLDSVPLPEGSILDLGVTALITTGGPQPVTYATIYAITHEGGWVRQNTTVVGTYLLVRR